MASDDQLKRIDLTDFRRGVASGWVSAQSDEAYPDGFAQESGTHGCYGLATGGLAPLPRITTDISGAEPTTGFSEGFEFPTSGGDEGYPEVFVDRIAVLDMHVVSPVHYLPDVSSAIDPADDPVDVLTVRQWWMVNGDGDVAAIYRFKGFPAYAGDPEAAWVQRHLDTQDYLGELTEWVPHPSRWRYGWGSICETRTQSEDNGETAAVYTVGPPVCVFGMGQPLRFGNMDDVEGIEASGYWTYPDFKDTNVDDLAIAQDRTIGVSVPLDAAPPGIVFGHQGRLCSIGRPGAYNIFRLLGYYGSHHGQRASSEIVSYWPTNAVYAGSISWATFLEESTSGYGAWSSVSANSLLLVKNKGGGVLINGDLSTPQVLRLPGLPSVGGLANRGVVTQRAADGPTDQGFVYGTSSGVWMWTGSDSAVELSSNLNARFWVPDDPSVDRRQPGQIVGSFAFSFPYLYAPNNWLYDMRGGGWWRYHPTPDQDALDGTTFAFNETDANGELWAMPASYTFDGRMLVKFSQQTPRDRFDWLSQPLVRSRGRMLNVREVEVVGSGRGRINVDVYGDDGSYQRTTLENDSEQMRSVLQPVGLDAKDVVVRIHSEAYDPDDAAPTLHRVSVGYKDKQSIGGQR